MPTTPKKRRARARAPKEGQAPGGGEAPGGAGTPGSPRASRSSSPDNSLKVGLTSPPEPPQPEATTPAKFFTSDEIVDAFMESVVDNDGVKPACRSVGLKSSAVFYWASQDAEFRLKLNAAMAAVLEEQAHGLNELCDELLTMDADERMKSANAYGKVIETRMRMLGKLLPKIYGEKPQTQITLNNNSALIVDEDTRQRLIKLREKILTDGKEVREIGNTFPLVTEPQPNNQQGD